MFEKRNHFFKRARHEGFKYVLIMESKTVIITGASAGIGKATAQLLIEQPNHLHLIARRPEKIRGWIDQMPSSKVKATFEVHQLDVSDKKQVDEFYENLRNEGATIHILINNAGFAKGVDQTLTSNPQDWQDMMQTNFFGAYYMAQQAIPMMPKNAGSRILNVGSIAGFQAYPGGGGYCASKFAMRAMTQSLRLELLEDGIGVSSIDPGMIETDFSIARLGDEDKAKNVYEGFTPLTAQDIAEMIVFMVTRPKHVNIDQLVTMPTAQGSAYHVNRKN